MKKVFQLLMVAALIATLTLAFVGCTKKTATLKMGTNAAFEPFEYKNGDGSYAGIDVDFANAIAKDMGVKVEIVDMDFDSLIPALKSGKVDFVAAGMTVTPDREENVNFTIKYYNASQSILVPKTSTIKTAADLVGKKIGVQQGTTGDTEGQKIKNATITSFKTGMEAVLDLNNGKLDAVIIDNSPARSFAAKNTNLKVIEGQFVAESYAFAVKKSNTDLLGKLNSSMQKLMDNGELKKIVDSYTAK